jgi:hypothetical protein
VIAVVVTLGLPFSARRPSGFPEAQVGAGRLIPAGRLAQLGEHLPYKQGVGGSIPSPPIIRPCVQCGRSFVQLDE